MIETLGSSTNFAFVVGELQLIQADDRSGGIVLCMYIIMYSTCSLGKEPV